MISIIRAGTGPAFHIACTSPSRLGDVPAGAQHDLAVSGPEPDLPLGDDRVLIRPVMDVRRDQDRDVERVLDHRHRTARRDRLSAETLLSAWPKRQRTATRAALIRHAVTFSTWRSLCLDQGMSNRDAVAAMVKLIC